MRITFDKEANALYIKILEENIAYSKEITPNIIVDFSEDNKPVGIEILNPKNELNKEEISKLIEAVS
ncbi:MAG: DUF2283 domain-containing protein [Hydrogenothermus sp.]|nr:MAG: DUF2283 domain-containing protein [Hydrogenothermus sp.]